ncbi:MAG TPA: hypothetical protein VJL81_16100 [Solirubrobacterales bacterium]|nr:hypothetical protein [Solirubrobacterales bacterium]
MVLAVAPAFLFGHGGPPVKLVAGSIALAFAFGAIVLSAEAFV